jgi:hypothetical protein
MPTGELAKLPVSDAWIVDLHRRLDDFENGLVNLAAASKRRFERLQGEIRSVQKGQREILAILRARP